MKQKSQRGVSPTRGGRNTRQRASGKENAMAENAPGFVGALVKDPKDVTQVKVYIGWLGASAEENHTRLYLSVDLSSYLEIPTDAILHQENIPAGESALGGVYVWVKSDAEVIQEPSQEKL